MNAAAVFSNVLDIVVSGSSKVSVTEAFLGLASPYVDPTDDCAAGDIPFNPAFVFGQNYSYPLLRVITDRGDVAITGVGGDPRSETNSLRDSLYVTSVAGDVKVEVSGNGIAANYTLVSDKGKTTVEVDGLAQPATGQLGVGSDPVAANTVYLYSRDGDVQMSLLPSPI